MRFAALQGGGASDYAAAGKKVANEAVGTFAVQRKSGPDYGKIAETGMRARSAEKRAGMEAGAQVAKAGINAYTEVNKVKIKEDTKAEVRGIGKKMRKAGAIGAIGGLVGAGFLATRDNEKGRERPDGTAAMKEVYDNYKNTRDGLIDQRESNRTNYVGSEYTPSESSSSSSSNSGNNSSSGGTAGKVAPGTGSALSGNQKIVADAIARYESGDWGYEAFNQGGTASGTKVVGKSGSHKDTFGRSLTDMTLGEIFHRQNTKQRGLSMQQHLDEGGLHAVGRYQFIGSTLQDEVNRMGLSHDTKFTPDVQDKIFISHIKRVGNISPWVGPMQHYSQSQKNQFNQMISQFN